MRSGGRFGMVLPSSSDQVDQDRVVLHVGDASQDLAAVTHPTRQSRQDSPGIDHVLEGVREDQAVHDRLVAVRGLGQSDFLRQDQAGVCDGHAIEPAGRDGNPGHLRILLHPEEANVRVDPSIGLGESPGPAAHFQHDLRVGRHAPEQFDVDGLTHVGRPLSFDDGVGRIRHRKSCGPSFARQTGLGERSSRMTSGIGRIAGFRRTSAGAGLKLTRTIGSDTMLVESKRSHPRESQDPHCPIHYTGVSWVVGHASFP